MRNGVVFVSACLACFVGLGYSVVYFFTFWVPGSYYIISEPQKYILFPQGLLNSLVAHVSGLFIGALFPNPTP